MKPRGRLPAARPRVDRLSIPTPTLPVTGPFDFGPQAQQSKAQLTARRLSIQVTMPLANGRLSRNLLKLLLTLRRLASRPSIQCTGLDTFEATCLANTAESRIVTMSFLVFLHLNLPALRLFEMPPIQLSTERCANYLSPSDKWLPQMFLRER